MKYEIDMNIRTLIDAKIEEDFTIPRRAAGRIIAINEDGNGIIFTHYKGTYYFQDDEICVMQSE